MLIYMAMMVAAPTVQEKAAIAAVTAKLKDPESARFKGLRIGANGAGCGWVNAKNEYGGYTGFAVFFINKEGKVAILTPQVSEPELCE